MTDEELILRYRDHGDREALAEIVRRHERPIYGLLLRVTRDPHRAEDAAQDTFLRMMRGLSTFRADLPFRPWLYRIALNAARSLHSSKPTAEVVPPPGGSMRPDEDAARREVQGFVNELPDNQREAVMLHYYQGLSHSEVAAALDMPAGTVATRIHQALLTLRTRLAALGIGLALEQFLVPDAEAAVPDSIQRAVLREATSPAKASSPVASTGATLRLPAVGAAVILALGIGAFVGYRFRESREAPSGVSARPPEPGPPRSAAVIGAQDPPKEKPTEKPAVPAQAPEPTRAMSNYRKLAAFMIKFQDTMLEVKDLNHLTPEETSKLGGLLLQAVGDPDLKGLLKLERGALSGTYDLFQFQIALLEETGAPPTTEQVKDLRSWVDRLNEQDAQEKAAETSIERRILEVRHSREAHDRLMGILTAGQWGRFGMVFDNPHIPIAIWAPSGKGKVRMGARFDATDPGVALPETWSKGVLGLSNDEKERLRDAATEHAQRRKAVQSEFRAKHGSDFMKALEENLIPEGAGYPVTEACRRKDPAFGRKLQEAYVRLLEEELEWRRVLMALLPEKAEALKKAPSWVFLIHEAE